MTLICLECFMNLLEKLPSPHLSVPYLAEYFIFLFLSVYTLQHKADAWTHRENLYSAHTVLP